MTHAIATAPVDVLGLDSAQLDCFDDNLQALLRHHGAADVRSPFASQWHFAFDEGRPRGLPGVVRTPVVDAIREATGWALQALPATPGDAAAACVVELDRGRPVLAIGDAYAMPWLPYCGHEHMDHSFIVDGVSATGDRLTIADAYTNKTSWGEATPGRAELPAGDIEAVLDGSDGWRGGWLHVLERRGPGAGPQPPRAAIRANATALLTELRERAALQRFHAFHAARVDDLAGVRDFTLACWIVARSRAAHALWLADVAGDVLAGEYRERVASAWQRAMEFSYLMERRVRAGRPAPRSALDMVEQAGAAEIDLAERLVAGGVSPSLRDGDTCVHRRFLEWACGAGDATAIDADGRRLSYAEAAAAVERLAGGLAERLPAGAPVALNLRKSPEAILLMLACMRAGLPYVPLDPASPSARRRLVLRESGARALVTDDVTAPGWAGAPELPGLDLVAGPGGVVLDEIAGGRAPDRDDPETTAYVLYTSGSTGRPKGVAITHRNAASFVDWAAGYAELGRGDRVAVHAPLHFDLPVLDVHASMTAGATVCPVDERAALFPQSLLRFLRDERITVLYAVPSALTGLLTRSTLEHDGLPDLRLLLYAGEPFHPAALRRLVAALPGVAVHNLYGPIETNVVTAIRVRPEHLDGARVPIGRPVPHARIFLVDADGREVGEPGREGEILVAGPSVTPGYLNAPALTAAARASVEADGRVWSCHRTGDFATRDADGVLDLRGRRDGLVKTRGFRVELGEVESTLADHPAVRESVVVAVPHPDLTNLLFGFVVVDPASDVDGAALAAWCRQALPGHAVPRQISIEADLPRTSTGKVARRQLADRARGRES
jgi:amino acid adenylation domain-containing protein